MKLVSKMSLAAFLGLFFVLAATTIVSKTAVAEGHDYSVAQASSKEQQENKSGTQEKTDNKQDTQTSTAQAPELGVYKYVAQPSDSYTLMARKAVQTYGKKFNVKLSSPGIVFAETKLTKAADSPWLTVGQNVEINETSVKQAVDEAQKLTPEQESAWNYYVQFVGSFNTDGVGQPS